MEDALKCLEARPGYIAEEKMEKTVLLIKENIVTAENVLKNLGDENIVSESDVNNATDRAFETIEVEERERQAEQEMSQLAQNLSSLAPTVDVIGDNVKEKESDEEQIERELEAIGKYQAERYSKMKKEIVDKMNFHHFNLIQKWKE